MTEERWNLLDYGIAIVAMLITGPFLGVMWGIKKAPPEGRIPDDELARGLGLVACWWLLLAGVWL